MAVILTGILFGCGPKVTFREDYDFKSVERVGVIQFDAARINFTGAYKPGNAVADEFVFQLLDRGIRVVERARIENILQEHNLNRRGVLDPATVKEAGNILGVDALIMGTVTRYIPDRKERVYVKDENGNIKEEIFLVEAEIGISTRMVDIETGEVIWAGSYTYDSFYIDTAIRHAVNSMLNSLENIWWGN